VGPQPAQAPPRVPNVTAHPSTASVPITILLYNGPLLCGFKYVTIKGLSLAFCKEKPHAFFLFGCWSKTS